MSKNLLILLAFTMLLAAGTLHAQTPGYLGHRNILRGDVYFFPSLKSYPTSYSGKPGFHFNNHVGIGYGRVTSRRTVVSLILDLTRGGAGDNRNPLYSRVLYNAIGTGLELKWHPFMRKGWIAPLGPYVSLAFRAMFVSSAYVLNSGGSTFNRNSHIGGSTALGLGYTNIIRGRILLGTGVRFAFTDYIQYLINSYGSSEFLYDSDFFKIHVGLGFLL